MERKTVSRHYDDPATGKCVTVAVGVDYPKGVNRASLLMELGAAFVDMVQQLTDSEPEPASFADLGISGSIGDDLLLWTLLGRLPEEQDKLKPKKGDDDAHVA